MRYILRSVHLPVGPKGGLTLNRAGYLDLWVGDGIKAICTSNVGGGSHIWAGLVSRAPAGFWNDRAAGLSDELLTPHYERLMREWGAVHPANPSAVPNATDHAWNNAGWFSPLQPGEQPPMALLHPQVADAPQKRANEAGVVRGELDYSAPNGMFGSPDGSKLTVDSCYLVPARRQGLVVQDMTQVSAIERVEAGEYRLHVRDLRNGRRRAIIAKRVVLAAGTMNSNSLMRKSVNAGYLGPLPGLGLGLGANGDLIGSWAAPGTDPVNSMLGTPIHGRVKIHGHEDAGYIILAGDEAPPLPAFMRRKSSRKFQLVAMSQDAADGRFWSDQGREKFAFSLTNSPTMAATMRAYDALAEMSGNAVTFDRKNAFTAHPMGGCRIGDDPALHVVNGRGEVHGHPGLFIADASVFPQPLGVPPSLSIGAWAAHVAQIIASDIQ
jgi:cholesterol oxidase